MKLLPTEAYLGPYQLSMMERLCYTFPVRTFKAFKAFTKPFEAPQRSVKIKI